MQFPRWQSVFPPKKSVTRPKLVLSVDDEPSLLYTTYRVLQAEGYAVLNAPGGAEGLRTFLRYPVDLVLLDYAMPGMDGGMVAEEMKRRKPQVPIIMLSGSSVPEGALSHADCFMRKGDGPALLLKMIGESLAALGKNSAVRKGA